MEPTDQALLFADLPTAQTRSAQMATRMGCDGVSTKYWYQIIALTNGQFAMVIQANGHYSTKPGPTALSQLTPLEITSLVPYSTVQSLLPVANTP